MEGVLATPLLICPCIMLKKKHDTCKNFRYKIEKKRGNPSIIIARWLRCSQYLIASQKEKLGVKNNNKIFITYETVRIQGAGSVYVRARFCQHSGVW